MKHTDNWIGEGMRVLAEREPPGEAPVALLVSRGRRSRRNRAALAVSASSMALALGTVGTAAVLSGLPGAEPALPPPPTTASVSRSSVATAAAATANTSYRLRYTDTVTPLPGVVLTREQQNILVAMVPLISEGAYDRRTFSGYLIMPQRGGGSTLEQRLVNGDQYVGPVGGPFQQNPGRHEKLSYPVIGSGALLTWAEPVQLLAHLGTLDGFTQTGPHTYRFQASVSAQPGKVDPVSELLTGEVTIGATSGMVEKAVVTGPLLPWGGEPYMQVSIAIEFSGFGEPVVVQRPVATSPST